MTVQAKRLFGVESSGMRLAQLEEAFCQSNPRSCAGCALAVCPPLVISREQVDELVDKLSLSIEQAA